ncbi:MAG: phasin family protein [Desulfobacteraceae bacterium]|nr:phasin family protein [Desulfobacteraceae bacterium]
MVLDLIRKGIYAGLGLIVVTGEEIRRTVDRFVEAGKLSAEDSEELFRDLTARGEKQQQEIQDWIAETVRSAMDRLDLPSRKQVEELAARVKGLEDRVDLLEDLRLRETRAPGDGG